ncbi:MAG: Rne/Rng family ribonuclease [Saprospirales bacterium]|nr:MAG: Rne/Rng family ribonuclease [Saprospirales bacterium]
MEKELIINSTPTNVEIALLENSKLVELHKEKTNQRFIVGDIYLGYIKKLMPGLNAAFVEIGHKKDAFLHYTDLGPNVRSLIKFTKDSIANRQHTQMLDNFEMQDPIHKSGKINQVFNKKQPVLVQVLKEPISTKGPRLSCEITIPGRNLVLSPFNDVIAISKKISNSDEKKRLQLLVESIKPKSFGVIVRTAAEGKKVSDLHEELNQLLEKWGSVRSQLVNSNPPVKILSELDKTTSILRDMLTDDFNRIVIDDKDLYSNVKGYLNSVAPGKANILSYYRGRTPIFDKYGVTRQIKTSFGKTSTMGSGAYLVIEHTEAMHVIDVNSGPKSVKRDQEEAAFSVNMESAEEIARQLRLRDLGGLIIVDYIDMRNNENKHKLYKAMRDYMKNDSAQHTVLPLSKFGLMQITRERVRPAVKIDTSEKCPSCDGSGKINSSVEILVEIERDLDFIIKSKSHKSITLVVHPFIAAYLKKGFPNKQHRWYLKYKKWIRVKHDTDLQLMDYRFFDASEDEIRLS